MKNLSVLVVLLLISANAFSKNCIITKRYGSIHSDPNFELAVYENVTDSEALTILTVIKPDGEVIKNFNVGQYLSGAETSEAVHARSATLNGSYVASITFNSFQSQMSLGLGSWNSEFDGIVDYDVWSTGSIDAETLSVSDSRKNIKVLCN